MKHAGGQALDRLEPMLRVIRSLTGLREKSRGVFYRGSEAFLHFHEDPAGLFADLKTGAEFVRHEVTTQRQRKAFVATLRRAAGAT